MTLITQPEVQGNGTDVTNEQVILLGMVLILIEELEEEKEILIDS